VAVTGLPVPAYYGLLSCSAGQLPGDLRQCALWAAFSQWLPFSTRPSPAYSSCSTPLPVSIAVALYHSLDSVSRFVTNNFI